jgi:hypothetical protein
MVMDHKNCQNTWLHVNKKALVDPGGYVQLEAKSGARAPATRGYLNRMASDIYKSDDCGEDAFVVFEMESETEAWGIGKVIERFILVTEDGDIEHLNMAAPGETLMEVVKYEPVSAGANTFERTSKTIFINPSTLRLVLGTEPGRKTCMCNAVDQRSCKHTAREAAQFPQAASARPTRTSTRNIQDTRQARPLFSSEGGVHVPDCHSRYARVHVHDHRRRRGGDGGLSGGGGGAARAGWGGG